MEVAFKKATDQGKNVKGVLISTPQNPIANIYSKETMQMLIDFTFEHKIHFVSDCLFARSVLNENGNTFISPFHCNIPDEHLNLYYFLKLLINIINFFLITIKL